MINPIIAVEETETTVGAITTITNTTTRDTDKL